MNCRDATALIEKLVDGEASESERSRAETHLASCETCRADKRFLERTAEAMKARARASLEQEAPAPAGYWDSLPERVLARIDEEPQGGWLKRAYPFMALAASLVIAVTAVLLTSRDRADDRSTEVATSQSPAASGDARAIEAEPARPAPKLPDNEADDLVARSAAPPSEALSADRAPSDADMAEGARPQAPPEGFSVESAEAARNLGYTAGETTDAPGETAGTALPASRLRRASEDRAAVTSEAEETDVAPSAAEEEVAQLESETRADANAGAVSGARAPAPAPAAPALLRERSLPMAVSVRSPCETLRAELSQLPDEAHPSERTEKLYELAQCSLQRYDTIGSAELKELAVSDLESFLAVESESARAKELQQALARLQ